MDTSQLTYQKRKASDWARVILAKNPIIVDLETTGLKDAEIVQIGIIDTAGTVLMDKLVKPTGSIPADVIRIHGITDTMVVNAPSFTDLYTEFSVLLAGKVVIAYNVAYEREVIRGECKRRRLPVPRISQWACAMINYAQFWGDWNRNHRSFKWQKLGNACQQQHIVLDNAHNATADCLATLAVLNKMAAFEG